MKPTEMPVRARTGSGKTVFQYEYLHTHMRPDESQRALDEREKARRDPSNPPLRDLVEVGLGLDEPDVENLKPLGEELGLEQLREHCGPEDLAPGQNVLERGEDLVPGVDLEVLAEGQAELGEDVLEDERVPFFCGEDLQQITMRGQPCLRGEERRAEATHILPVFQLLRHPILHLPPLEHPADPPLRVSENLFHAVAEEG